MGHGTVADEIKGRAAQFVRRALRRDPGDRGGGRPVPLLPRRLDAVHGARRRRWRSRRRCGRTSRSCSTSARRSTAAATTPRARPSARTAGSTAASPGTRSMDPRVRLSTGSSRAGSRRTCGARRRRRSPRATLGGIAIGGTLGEDKAQMFEVVEWTIEELPEAKPRHLLGIGEVDDLVRGVELGIDTFDCAMPTRIGRHGMAVVPDPAKRWRVDLAKARWKESDEPLLDGCPCPACAAGLHPRVPALPVQGQGADRDAAAHDPQPGLPAAPDGGAARRDRRGRLAAAAAAVRAGAAPWELGVEAFKAFEAAGWSARAATYDALMARATAVAIEPLLDAARAARDARARRRLRARHARPPPRPARRARHRRRSRRRHARRGPPAPPGIEFVRGRRRGPAVRRRRVRRRARRVPRQPPAGRRGAVAELQRVARHVALAAGGPRTRSRSSRSPPAPPPASAASPTARTASSTPTPRGSPRSSAAPVDEMRTTLRDRLARRPLGRHPRRHGPHGRPARAGHGRRSARRPRAELTASPSRTARPPASTSRTRSSSPDPKRVQRVLSSTSCLKLSTAS